MAFKGFGRKKQVAAAPPATGALEADHSGDTKRYAEAFVLPRLREARMTLIAFVALIVAVLEAGALILLRPMHERVPYIAEFTEDGGIRRDERFQMLEAQGAVKQPQLNYFVKLWVRRLFTIDSMLSGNLERLAPWVRGAAANELVDWLSRLDRPVAKRSGQPDLTREVSKLVISYGSGRVIFVHVDLTEKLSGVETARYKKLLQIEYSLLPELVDEEAGNPIGLAITHFTVADA